jgi:hypothetical protein
MHTNSAKNQEQTSGLNVVKTLGGGAGGSAMDTAGSTLNLNISANLKLLSETLHHVKQRPREDV